MPILKDTWHTAKKPYECDWCGGYISPGERYRYLFGSADYHNMSALHLCKKVKCSGGEPAKESEQNE